jgi:hypothetical protein
VVAALTLVDLPPDGERIDIDIFLRKGGTITLEYDYGHPGSTTPDGDVDQEPIPERYIAHAKEPDGSEIGHGEGDSVAEALLSGVTFCSQTCVASKVGALLPHRYPGVFRHVRHVTLLPP